MTQLIANFDGGLLWWEMVPHLHQRRKEDVWHPSQYWPSCVADRAGGLREDICHKVEQVKLKLTTKLQPIPLPYRNVNTMFATLQAFKVAGKDTNTGVQKTLSPYLLSEVTIDVLLWQGTYIS